MSVDKAKLLHDLRAPLARAKTIAKLLKNAPECAEELLPELLTALEELDQKLGEELAY